MKYKYNVTKQKEIELTFPSFVRFGECYYKLINEKQIITVDDFICSKSIEFREYGITVAFGNDGWKFISEEEFNSAHQRVSDYLQSFLVNPELA